MIKNDEAPADGFKGAESRKIEASTSSFSCSNELRLPISATISYAVVSLTFRFSPILIDELPSDSLSSELIQRCQAS
jgi:hypothetical protein